MHLSQIHAQFSSHLNSQSITFMYFGFHCIHSIGLYVSYQNFRIIKLLFTTFPINPINCGQNLYSISLTCLSFNTSYLVHYCIITIKQFTLTFYEFFSNNTLSDKIRVSRPPRIKIVHEFISNHLESISRFHNSIRVKIVFLLSTESQKRTL